MSLRTGNNPVEFEAYRQELTGHCYRMLGSGFEAEDAVQETMVKAIQSVHALADPSATRSWLYRIATNVCIDMGRQVQRRARPADLGPASAADESLLGQPHPEVAWVCPLPDRLLSADPADVAELRATVRLAFVAALQLLPARQRAVLLLCDVLRWSAAEAAAVLECSAAAASSALQRARATLEAVPPPTHAHLEDGDDELLHRYVDAFERYDMDAFVSLLHEDAVQSMPPFAMWLRGARAITDFMVLPGPSKCRGSRLLATRANGCPAFGQYMPDPAGGFQPWAIQVLEISGNKICELALFLQPLEHERLFASFGLPMHLDV